MFIDSAWSLEGKVMANKIVSMNLYCNKLIYDYGKLLSSPNPLITCFLSLSRTNMFSYKA
jgi:hypothetical protein